MYKVYHFSIVRKRFMLLAKFNHRTHAELFLNALQSNNPHNNEYKLEFPHS